MPELPEVETVARTLAPQVCGRRIVGITVLNSGTWQGGTAADEVESLTPRILGVSRRGKLLLWEQDVAGSIPVAPTMFQRLHRFSGGAFGV